MLKVLNLYAGIGGNRKFWPDDVDVTAVELDSRIADVYKYLYPNDTVIVEDAHEFLLQHFKEYDFIWASPPCPTHSRLGYEDQIRHNKPKYPDMKLYQEIILLHKQFKNGKFVVENVIPYYDPLIKPTVKLARHYFWTNFDVPEKEFPKLYNGSLHNSVVADLEKAYGIFLPDWAVNKRLLLRNVCRPDVGKYLYDLAKISDGKIS